MLLVLSSFVAVIEKNAPCKYGKFNGSNVWFAWFDSFVFFASFVFFIWPFISLSTIYPQPFPQNE